MDAAAGSTAPAGAWDPPAPTAPTAGAGSAGTAPPAAGRLPFRAPSAAEALAAVSRGEVVEVVRREVVRAVRESGAAHPADQPRSGRAVPVTPADIATADHARALLAALRRAERDERFRLGMPG